MMLARCVIRASHPSLVAPRLARPLATAVSSSPLPGTTSPAAEEIAALVARSRAAQAQIAHYSQEQVDDLITAMVWSVCEENTAKMIAQHTVDETRLGNYDGKFLKIFRKTRATLQVCATTPSQVWLRELNADARVSHAVCQLSAPRCNCQHSQLMHHAVKPRFEGPVLMLLQKRASRT